jgi:hypothetical protein
VKGEVGFREIGLVRVVSLKVNWRVFWVEVGVFGW